MILSLKLFPWLFLAEATFTNEAEIIKELQPASMKEFFKSLTEDVKNYYGV